CIGNCNIQELALALRQAASQNLVFVAQPELSEYLKSLVVNIAVVIRERGHVGRLALAREDRKGDVVEHAHGIKQVYDLKAARNAYPDAFRYRRIRNVVAFEQDLPRIRF